MSSTGPRGENVSTGGRKKRRTPPWWCSLGWVVVRHAESLYGWRTFKSGHTSSAFTVEIGSKPVLALLNEIEREITMLQRATRPKTEGGVTCVQDADLAKKCPALAAHLCQTTWEDGEARQTSTLSIFTGDGCFKACLRDRELGLCLWVAAKCYAALPLALEAALTDPNTVWRVDRQTPGVQASRKKK